MKTIKPRRPGRPLKAGDNRAGEYVGFRSPKTLKAALEKAAVKASRSLSSEVQFRLEQSFRDDRVLEAIGELARRL